MLLERPMPGPDPAPFATPTALTRVTILSAIYHTPRMISST